MLEHMIMINDNEYCNPYNASYDTKNTQMNKNICGNKNNNNRNYKYFDNNHGNNNN